MSEFWQNLLQHFETERLMAYANQAQIGDLVQNPYFLGAAAALTVIALLLRWQWVAGTIICLTGFAWLLSYTLAQGTELGDSGNPVLLVFVGGGAVIIGLAIYIFFIRSE